MLPPWQAVRLINRSAWPANVKNLARTMLEWRDATTGELFPAVPTIAAALGVAESTARGYIGEAIDCGALVVVGARKGGTGPTRYRLVLPGPPTPPDSGGVLTKEAPPDPAPTPPDSGPHPVGFRPPPHRIPAPTPPNSGPEPSMHPPREPASEPSSQSSALLTRDECMQSPLSSDTRSELQRFGIRGRNLAKLAASTLTPEEVREEAARVQADRSVRNAPAVLAYALAQLVGVELSKPRSLTFAESSAVTGIESMRRQRAAART